MDRDILRESQVVAVKPRRAFVDGYALSIGLVQRSFRSLGHERTEWFLRSLTTTLKGSTPPLV